MLKPERPADKAGKGRVGSFGASPLEIKRHPPVFRQCMCTFQHGCDQREDPGDWTMAVEWSVQTPEAGAQIPLDLADDGHSKLTP